MSSSNNLFGRRSFLKAGGMAAGLGLRLRSSVRRAQSIISTPIPR